jgi:hypothetical protein
LAQEDIRFAVRWSVNHKKFEAGLVELKGESRLFKNGWMNFQWKHGKREMVASPRWIWP